MNIYNSNLIYLCDQKKISITEFENIIYIPKVRIIDPQPMELLRIADYFDISIDLLLKKDLKKVKQIETKNIELIILDVDGTMTDGGMYFSESGDQMKKYNTKDGMAIKNLTSTGKQFGIISHGHKHRMVKDRAVLLGIQNVYVGQDEKVGVLEKMCESLKIELDNVAFIGDDINDIEVMEKCGLAVCPADAMKDVKTISDIILKKNGGAGCVREFLDEWIS